MAKQKKQIPSFVFRHPSVTWILILIVAAFVLWEQYAPQDESADSSVAPTAADASSASALFTAGGPMEVHFLDVGQGDSELIRIPTADGYFDMLIDTGEYQHADGLVAYLKSQNITKLDAVVATHPHADHIGSMATVIRSFDIGDFYMPRLPEDQTPTTKSYETMLDALLEKNVSVHEIYKDSYVDAPVGTVIEVAAPEKDAVHKEINNYSAVMRLTYGSTSFLFTGDAEAESEDSMLTGGKNLQAQVLKCGHHGSHSSTTEEFLQAVSPQYAVISCGADNSYGHPHKETLAALQDFGCEILRTDTMGTIVMTSDGKSLSVETGRPSAQ